MVARKVTKNRAVPLTVTMDEADRAELDGLARKAQRSLAHLVREAIGEYLEKRRGGKKGG